MPEQQPIAVFPENREAEVVRLPVQVAEGAAQIAKLLLYAVHAKRGRDALAAFGLLAAFRGILGHDHSSANAIYTCQHAFCNAHHLCELIAITETYPELSWPKLLRVRLCKANEATCMARAVGVAALPSPVTEGFVTRYEALLAEGARYHPRRTGPPGRRGRVKQTPAYNLIGRLRDHRQEVLRLITDLRVPFDSNQAERDLRLALAHAANVSGCIRSEDGAHAHAFATIRSYLPTLRKQSGDPKSGPGDDLPGQTTDALLGIAWVANLNSYEISTP
jgi:transposase